MLTNLLHQLDGHAVSMLSGLHVITYKLNIFWSTKLRQLFNWYSKQQHRCADTDLME